MENKECPYWIYIFFSLTSDSNYTKLVVNPFMYNTVITRETVGSMDGDLNLEELDMEDPEYQENIRNVLEV